MEKQGSWRNVNCRRPESGFEFPEVVRLNKDIVAREKQNPKHQQQQKSQNLKLILRFKVNFPGRSEW